MIVRSGNKVLVNQYTYHPHDHHHYDPDFQPSSRSPFSIMDNNSIPPSEDQGSPVRSRRVDNDHYLPVSTNRTLSSSHISSFLDESLVTGRDRMKLPEDHKAEHFDVQFPPVMHPPTQQQIIYPKRVNHFQDTTSPNSSKKPNRDSLSREKDSSYNYKRLSSILIDSFFGLKDLLKEDNIVTQLQKSNIKWDGDECHREPSLVVSYVNEIVLLLLRLKRKAEGFRLIAEKERQEAVDQLDNSVRENITREKVFRDKIQELVSENEKIKSENKTLVAKLYQDNETLRNKIFHLEHMLRKSQEANNTPPPYQQQQRCYNLTTEPQMSLGHHNKKRDAPFFDDEEESYLSVDKEDSVREPEAKGSEKMNLLAYLRSKKQENQQRSRDNFPERNSEKDLQAKRPRRTADQIFKESRSQTSICLPLQINKNIYNSKFV